jgi:hypothetical protein
MMEHSKITLDHSTFKSPCNYSKSGQRVRLTAHQKQQARALSLQPFSRKRMVENDSKCWNGRYSSSFSASHT